MSSPNLTPPAAPPQSLAHYTLNTGHLHESPLSEVDPEVTEALAVTLQEALSGRPLRGLPGYIPKGPPATVPGRVCELTARRDYDLLTFDLCALDGPPRLLVRGAVGRIEGPETDAFLGALRAAVEVPDWPDFDGTGYRLEKVPRLAAPWLVVQLGVFTLDEAAWLGDLERCLAWAWCSA